MTIKNKKMIENIHPEILYILKTDQTSVSEITEHKVLSHSVYGKRQHPKPESLIHRYTIENHRDVELAEDENFREDRHLMSTIGNTDPWISSTLVFRNIDDANIRREKELERINKTT